jgi:hypothetical protein
VATKHWWVAQGRRAIVALLNEQLATTLPEMEARLSDRTHPSMRVPIQPHILADARNELIDAGRIIETRSATRGGQLVRTFHPADTNKRSEAIEQTAARKRVLTARYRSWGSGSIRYPLGLIGTAGERVVQDSIREAAGYGLRYAGATGGEVRVLLGDVVEGGALDGAIWAQPADDQGKITNSTLCPIEVKNVRHWIYPRNREVFQLLYKSALLSQRIDAPICPVLITRRKAKWSNDMSRALGFRIVDVGHQFVMPISDVDDDSLRAVQDELGFFDMVRTDRAHVSVVDPLRKSVLRRAAENAERWRAVGSQFADLYRDLREDNLDEETRSDLLMRLGLGVRETDPNSEVRWAGLFDTEEDENYGS